ncbi:MAG: ankyrin repeat domain-containing protein, partial [Candidatus Poribacteria bacterium]
MIALGLSVALCAAALSAEGQIIDAARSGDVDALRSLLAEGADANTTQGDGMTALHWAAERGHSAVAELLLSAGADGEAQTRVGSYTPLHLASRSGYGPIVRTLLDAGAAPDATTTNTGVTPLHLAAGAVGGADAVAALLERGATVDAREASSGQTPLMFASAYNRSEAVVVLLQHDADPAVQTKAVDVLRSMAIDREANQRFRDAIDDFRDAEAAGRDWEPSPTNVQAAIRAQREFLLSDYDPGPVDGVSLARVNSEYPGGPSITHPPYRESLVGRTGGMSALLHASREGHVASALALLDGGADIDQVSADNTSPLLMATLNGQFDLAMHLVERGADPNVAAITDGATPLFAVLQTHWAPKSNYPQPRAHDNQQAEYMDVMRVLLESGANPDRRLNTHLWYWEYGLTKIGLDLTGATPFWRAALAQDVPAMRLLVSYGADPNIPTMWPAVGMRERRQQDGRQQEDSGLPSIPQGIENAYPLHAATGGGYLGLGAFSMRSTPDQFIPAVRYLIEELGAEVNLLDSWLYTPLHYAASRGDNAMIEYLVSQGGDVKAITRLGQSTADMARGGRAGFFTRVAFPETSELLQELGSTLECLHTHFLDTGDFCD